MRSAENLSGVLSRRPSALNLVAALLANAAEERQGLVYVLGGFWDTMNVPPGQPVVFRGTLVIRLLAARPECNRVHPIEVRCVDEDGQQVFNVNLSITPTVPPGHPLAWLVPVTMVAAIQGPLPRAGLYNIAILADNAQIAEVPFRVVELPTPAVPESPRAV